MGSTFTTYELAGLLPEGHHLILNGELHIMTQVTTEGELIGQQVLTDAEYELVEVLLRSFPHYSPLEELLAVFTGKSIDRCRTQLIHAQDIGGDAFDSMIRPLRNTMSRCRMKLETFGLDAKAIIMTGYLLMPLKASISSEKERR